MSIRQFSNTVISTKSKYQAVAVVAPDRDPWREIVQNVTQFFYESREERVINQVEFRKRAEAN